MPEIEQLGLKHSTYDKLIKGGITNTEQLHDKDTPMPVLEMDEVSEIALKLRDIESTASRARQVMNSDEVMTALRGLSHWEEIVEASVQAYERMFGPKPPVDEDAELAEAVKRIGGIMDKHGVGTHDD